MPHITLTLEQVDLLLEAPGEVEVRGPDGRLLGYLSASDERAFIEWSKQDDPNQPSYSSAQVRDLLRQLHEAHEAGMDKEGLRLLYLRILAQQVPSPKRGG